jgi:hypothetical protein
VLEWWERWRNLLPVFILSCGRELTAPKTVQPSLASIFFLELLVPHSSGEEQRNSGKTLRFISKVGFDLLRTGSQEG